MQKCSDKLSLGEKIVYHLLDNKKIEFQHEVSFKWSERKRYDFYISSLNTIVEVHGIQHYEQTNRKGARTLQQEQENDSLKKDLTISNGIENYIVIDARESNLNWISKNILKSNLSTYLNIMESDFINLNLKHNLITLRIWNLWNSGLGVMAISEEMKMSKKAVGGYLKTGSVLGKCSYDSVNRYDKIKKSVVKLAYNGEYISRFESLIEAKENDSKKSLQLTIYPFNTIRKTDSYIWVYEDEYLTHQHSLVDKIKAFNVENSIYQLDKNFKLIAIHIDSVSASLETGFNYFNIRSACGGVKSKTYKGFIWLTYEKYKNLKENKITEAEITKKNYKAQKVVKLSLDGDFIAMYDSMSEASRQNPSTSQSHISGCCRKIRKTCGGFVWLLQEDYENSIKVA